MDNLTCFGLNVGSTSDSSRRSKRGSADAGEDSLSAHQTVSAVGDIFDKNGVVPESYTKIWEKFPVEGNNSKLGQSKSPNLKYSTPFCKISIFL